MTSVDLVPDVRQTCAVIKSNALLGPGPTYTISVDPEILLVLGAKTGELIFRVTKLDQRLHCEAMTSPFLLKT